MSCTVYLWERMTQDQQQAALAHGAPPSGPEGVLWICYSGGSEWRFKTGLHVEDLRRGRIDVVNEPETVAPAATPRAARQPQAKKARRR